MTQIEEQLAILDKCKVCRVALQDKQGLYLVPLNFGYQYEDGHLILYFHSAKSGRKIDALQENSAVAFEMDCAHRLIEAENPCQYGYAFASIIGNGDALLVENREEKKKALSLLMKHQTGKDFTFDNQMADAVAVFGLMFPSSAQNDMSKINPSEKSDNRNRSKQKTRSNF